MLNRRSRWQSLFLSPGVSVIVAALGALLMVGASPLWYVTLPLSAAIAVAMVMVIKARMLFKGPNFPFAAFFMLLQGIGMQSLAGCIVAVLGTLSLIVGFHSFLRKDFRHSIFLLFLLCGVGAVWFRGFALLAVAVYFTFFAVRAMSMRGTVAALLGLITPVILLSAAGVINPLNLPGFYSEWELMPLANDLWLRGHDYFVVGAMAVIVSLSIFLTAYGYPAKPRARNMAVFVMTAFALVMPVVDFAHVQDYMPLINVCTAYQLTHLVATRRFGWVLAIIAWGVCITMIFVS